MSTIQNPAGAFGYPVPNTPDGGYTSPFHYVCASTVVAGQAVAFTGTQGKVQTQLTNGPANVFAGVALESGVAGKVIQVAKAGPVTVAKHAGAALTAGNFVGAAATTAGQMALVATTAAVTQAKDLGVVMGVVIADAASADTTVLIEVRTLT